MADKMPSIQPTPERHPTLASLARMLQSVDKFGRTPFGYSNPPVEILSDVLQVPALTRTLENMAYGSPLTRGTGQARVLTPDTKGAAEALLNLAPAAPALTRTAIATSKAAAPYAARQAVQLAEKYGVAPTMNIIKPKGGNWLAGSVEEAVRPLKVRVDPELEGYALRGQNLMPHEAEDVLPKMAINKWLDTKLSKYIRNEMGTEEDPLRALAARGVTHVPNKEDLMMSGDWIPEETARGRRLGGYPEDPTHLIVHAERGYPEAEEEAARLAAGWENAADTPISSGTVGEMINIGKSEPWMEKADKFTNVYGINPKYSDSMASDLGFNHLVDELKNAMRADSGLPQHLRLDPNKIDKVTVPQAVELVDKINQWRAEQKIVANAEKANNAATVVHKEYPEQGYRWVEIKNTAPALEGRIFENPNPQFGSPFEFIAPDGTVLRRAKSMKELELGLERDAKQAGYASLEEALRYEGDTMGHCVGGYCPDVNEGRTRIFSLRDKKGEPHVTIEVKPGAFSSPEEAVSLGQHPDNGVPRIVQIKGKANRKPKDEYLPFVQDFVRSGKWSDVGDIQNTGMRATRDVFSEGELAKLREAGEDLPHILSGQDIQRLHNMIVPEGRRLKYDDYGNVIGNEFGFAEGGMVGDPQGEDQMGVNRMVELQEGGVPQYAGGGLVGLESKYGLDPYGIRHAGDSVKGLGYFGAIPGRSGHMTEVSAEDDLGEFPLLVPGLTADEIRHLANDGEPTEEIYRKAEAHAEKRRKAGRSTFIEQGELRHPKPEGFASGGVVSYNPAEIENAVARLREDMYA